MLVSRAVHRTEAQIIANVAKVVTAAHRFEKHPTELFQAILAADIQTLETNAANDLNSITADLTDRMQAERVCRQLAAEHADATLLVNAAGLFVPKPFLDHDGADYDSYAELDRAIFFVTQTVVRGMIAQGRAFSALRSFQ